MIRRMILSLVFLGVIAGTAFAQSEVTIVSDKDNTLYESSTGALSNGAGIHFFTGRTNQPAGQSIRRGLISFDIAGNVESGATIENVVLTLTMSKTIAAAQDIKLHRVSADWGEGTSNAGTSADGKGIVSATGDATWIHTFFSSATWTTPGGDFSSTVSATKSVAGNGSYSWGSTTEMVADVQGWLDDDASNFGWIVVGNESTSITSKQFGTREITSIASRPTLVVTFAPIVSVVEEKGKLPTEYNLAQNFPNPFNPVTTVAYQLPQTGRVSLIVYDLLGAEVATLVNSVQSAGNHSVKWNAINVASGIYFYRLEAGNFTQTRKLVVIK